MKTMFESYRVNNVAKKQMEYYIESFRLATKLNAYPMPYRNPIEVFEAEKAKQAAAEEKGGEKKHKEKGKGEK